MKKVLLTLAITTIFAGCKKDDNDSRIYKGQEVAVYHGKAWSWIKLKEDGAPEQFSITLDNAALNTVDTGTHGGHQHENNIVVPLPAPALTATPFKFLYLNWSPVGHEPPGIYDIPHFDIHYYMVTESEVMAATDMAKINNHPSPAYLPANYVAGPGFPQMGKHWIDITSPELNGHPFTETFLYGSYDGKVTFYEPMITLNFLKNTTLFERAIPQPERFAKDGWYPTRLRVVKQGGATHIILEGFVKRQAS